MGDNIVMLSHTNDRVGLMNDKCGPYFHVTLCTHLDHLFIDGKLTKFQYDKILELINLARCNGIHDMLVSNPHKCSPPWGVVVTVQQAMDLLQLRSLQDGNGYHKQELFHFINYMVEINQADILVLNCIVIAV